MCLLRKRTLLRKMCEKHNKRMTQRVCLIASCLLCIVSFVIVIFFIVTNQKEEQFFTTTTTEQMDYSTEDTLDDVNVTSLKTLNKQDLWRHNYVAVASFQCKTPQPRAIAAAILLQSNNVTLSPAESIIPITTVLYRCAVDSGCCLSEGTLCGVDSSEDIYLTFRKTNFLNKNTDGTILNVTAQNHTSCACLPKKPNIK